MKTLCLLVVGIAVLTSGLRAYAAEAPQAASDHLALAASYEQKAAEQDALIAEHEQMKKDYRQRFFVNEKVTPMGKIRKMNDHCDTIVHDAKKLKDDLLHFAAWHRMRARELQGG